MRGTRPKNNPKELTVSITETWATITSGQCHRLTASMPRCIEAVIKATVYHNVLELFMIPSAEDLYGDADFIFKQDLAPTQTARSTETWIDVHAITVLDWPANSPD